MHKNWVKRMTAGILAIGLAVGPLSVYAEETENSRFDQFMKDRFAEAMSGDYMNMHFTVKDYEAYGIEKPEATLGRISRQDYEDIVQDAREELEELEEFDYDRLDDERKTDYDVYRHSLQETIDLSGYWQMDDYFNASTGVLSNLLTTFTEYAFYQKSDVDDYLQVLASVPTYLDDALALTKEQAAAGFFLTDEQLEEANEAIDRFLEKTDDNALITVFDENMDRLDFLGEEEKQAYKEQNRTLVLDDYMPAVRKVQTEINALAGSRSFSGGLCNYGETGKAYYEALAKSKSSTTMSVEEQFDFLGSFLADVIDQYIAILRANPSVSEAYEQEVVDVSTPEEILKQLQENLQDFPEGPQVTYRVDYLDPSVANDSIMAYYLEPPIDDLRNNVIKINKDNINDTNTLYGTLAHEGFPGHLYQITWFLNTNPNPLRAALSNIGYTEGWAMYVEVNQYAKSSLSADVAKLQALDTTLGYVLDAAADLAVNGLGYEQDDLAEWMDDLGLNSDGAYGLYDFAISQPGQILPYGFGMAKFLSLKAQAQHALGDSFDIKAFHEVLLTGGDRPFEMVERAVKEWVQEQGGSASDLDNPSVDDFFAQNEKPSAAHFLTSRTGIYVIAGAAILLEIIILLVRRHYRNHDPFQ